jgi:hypothetical protein
MKKLAITLAAIVALALPVASTAQATNTALAGVSFFTSVPATATQTVGPVRLPNNSGSGVINITESGITGSPSGCRVRLFYSQNNATTLSAAAVTQAFTPATNIQQFSVTASPSVGDAYTATYDCTSTYPTAGLISVSFSPTTATVPGTSAVTVTSGTVTTITNPVTVNAANTPGTTDPCQNPALLKTTLAVNISGAAGTTELVAPSGATAVYACYFHASFVGTSPTYLMEYGTSTACTGTHALTGTIAVPTTTFDTLGNGSTAVLVTPASQGLCLVAGGTTPSIQGVLTFVQQ